MWQKVYQFGSDGYISFKNLYEFSIIYKHKYAYLKPQKSGKQTNFMEETNQKNNIVPNTGVQSRSNVKQCILECKYLLPLLSKYIKFSSMICTS